jgi:acetyl-CoA acetyltransferase
MVCMLMDGGAALVVTAVDRAKDFPKRPVYLLGSGEAYEGGIFGTASMRNPIAPEYARQSARLAFAQAGLKPSDMDHVMIYDAFAHCVHYGLEAMGFVRDGEAASFIGDGHTRTGGSLPTNTNGGGLSYVHTGSYGMFLMQEAIRQLRGEAAAQLQGARFSACHGWGGYWSACATVIFGSEVP